MVFQPLIFNFMALALDTPPPTQIARQATLRGSKMPQHNGNMLMYNGRNL